MTLVAFAVAVLLGVTGANSRISSVSRTVIINDVPYYLPAEPLLTLVPDVLNVTGDVLPFTLLTDFTDESSVRSSVESWETIDDVFNKEFLNSE
jgi:hypothetical protein